MSSSKVDLSDCETVLRNKEHPIKATENYSNDTEVTDKYEVDENNFRYDDSEVEERLHKTIPLESRSAGKPPDGGWGWLVAFGGFINAALSHMIGTCFSIIFSHFLLDLHTSSTTVAWIYNLQSCIFNLAGLMVGPLTQEFGWRKVAFAGALSSSLSLICSAFAPTAEFMYFSFGILAGFGSGTNVCLSMLIVPRFFEKRRGRANSILMAGFCIGQMIGPPFTRYLQSEYGFVGGTVLIGGILLNGFVGASLFHPVEWHLKRSNVITDSPAKQKDYAIEVNRNESTKDLSNKNNNCSNSLLGNDSGAREKRIRLSSVSSSIFDAVSSIGDLATPEAIIDAENIHSDKTQSYFKVISNIFQRLMYTTMTSLKILRLPSALIIAISNTLFINGYVNFIMMVPFSMQASGHSLDSSAWCISISAICNLISRLAANSLSDFSWFNIKLFYMMGLALVSLSNFMFAMVNDLYWLMFFIGAWGFGVGATMGVYSLIMIEVLGLEKMTSCFGATCLLTAIGYITLGPLMGYVRDISSSYAVSMCMSASLVAISFILWLFMPLALSYEKRKYASSNNKT